MLIRFSVENFRSIKGEAVFEMVASKDVAHSDHVIDDPVHNIRLLRAAALYGANASGKSNLIEAVGYAKNLILEGTKGDESLAVPPFRLEKSMLKRPSSFEFTFRQNGTVYTYGFVLERDRVVEEWLFARPKRHERILFERVTDSLGRVTVEFGPDFAGRNKKTRKRAFLEFVAEGTRPTQLFLTEAVQRNVEEAKDVISWFKHTLQVVRAESRYRGLEVVAHHNKEFSDFLGDLLRSVDTGVDGIETTAVRYELDDQEDMPEEVKRQIREGISNRQGTLLSGPDGTFALTPDKTGRDPVKLKIQTLHRMRDGSAEHFDLDDESDGTIRLIHLVPIIFNSLSRECVYLIDELDRRLHPLLTIAFLQKFFGTAMKGTGSQLIFTTHDTNLLDRDLLRHDEVWFVQKDRYGATRLYSLADFKVRKGLKVEKGYLNGRFGAIPFIGSVKIDIAREEVHGSD